MRRRQSREYLHHLTTQQYHSPYSLENTASIAPPAPKEAKPVVLCEGGCGRPMSQYELDLGRKKHFDCF